jgi:dipeptide/tripeptide permease
MSKNKERTPFSNVFWVANFLELLERFAYYGIYMGFGIYMQHLGFSEGQLGVVQSIFLTFSYTIPVISGTFADKYGFKKVLIVSYLAYLPSILFLILFQSYSGIALTMLSIGLAAGIFKPLISGTIRSVTDSTNKTLGFGIFYAMVNVGASFGPIIMGSLRRIDWKYAFYAAAIGIGVALVITIFFYKEPDREFKDITLGQKFKDIGIVLSDGKFALFLLLLGVFFWLPFWAFFNLCALYIDKNLDTIRLYNNVRTVLGPAIANFLSEEHNGTRKLLGETISHTGYVIMILQVFVSNVAEKFEGMKTFLFGLLISAIGMTVIGLAKLTPPAIVLLGIAIFALGEMISSPRIQEYITWIAPKEKAGLYMGTNFLATGIGAAFSGVTYTTLYGYVRSVGHPEYVWYALAAHLIVGIGVIKLFTAKLGEFEELEE